MRARRMLLSGYQGFLATVVDTNHVEKSKPEDIAVVREFSDVFPEELPSLPLDRIAVKDNTCIKSSVQNGPCGTEGVTDPTTGIARQGLYTF